MSETRKFTENILTTSREKAEKIVSEAEAETRKAMEEAESHLSREADEILRNARIEAEAVKRRHTSEVKHRLKLREQQEKSKILLDVLEQTKKRSADLAKDEERYFQFLVGLVANGIRELGMNEVIVHLNANDLRGIDRRKLDSEIAKRLEMRVKIEWSNDQLDALGGAIVASPDGKTRIVNTIDQRFEALEPKLLIEAGRLLFSD